MQRRGSAEAGKLSDKLAGPHHMKVAITPRLDVNTVMGLNATYGLFDVDESSKGEYGRHAMERLHVTDHTRMPST